MQVEDFLLLDATVARSNESDSKEDIGELSEICCIITHLYSTLEDDLELIQDDETLDDASVSSWRNRPLVAEDDSAEDLKKIAADINTCHARSCAQARPSDNNNDSIRQLDVDVQTKKEIEKEVADLVDHNTKSKKDLEKELRVTSSLRKSIIKEELEGLVKT